MRRVMLSLFILLAPVVGLLAITGCEPEIKTVQKTERIDESPSEPVSPGNELLE